MQKNKCRTFSLKTLLFNQNLLSVILKIGFLSKGKINCWQRKRLAICLGKKYPLQMKISQILS